MLRTPESLRREQAEIVSAYRRERAVSEAVVTLPRPGVAAMRTVYGRVAEVVASDPEHGPHLMVVRQAFAGTPPVLADVTDAAAVRCHPAPGRIVSDYAVDDVVRIVAAHGAMVAERVG
jgi:hypothetical protein